MTCITTPRFLWATAMMVLSSCESPPPAVCVVDTIGRPSWLCLLLLLAAGRSSW
jgi:hypothetical protein